MTKQNAINRQPELKFDFNNMFATVDITEEMINDWRPELARAVADLAAARQQGRLEWLDLPYSQEQTVLEIEQLAAVIREDYENFVVIGIGGSCLGAQALLQALNHIYYNALPPSRRQGPRVYFMDNSDPEKITALLDVLDLSRTVFNVITKSGGTAETMAQFMIMKHLLQENCVRQGKAGVWHDQIIATTDSRQGSLLKIAGELGIRLFYIPATVGGRFSVLSPVGLLPAAVSGIDIRGLLQGAALMDSRTRTAEVWRNPALLAAALQIKAFELGCNISIMMPYIECLKHLADWYVQLWAESLGKRCNRQGQEIFWGQTPVKAVGSTDQHSQLQLYSEGPRDKVLIFIAADKYRRTIRIPELGGELPALEFLSGHEMGELLSAEQRATAFALQQQGRLNYTIHLPEINALTMGQLLYFLEVETALAGEILQLNAYDQPGVETSKNATYALLGKPGFEELRAQLLQKTPSGTAGGTQQNVPSKNID